MRKKNDVLYECDSCNGHYPAKEMIDGICIHCDHFKWDNMVDEMENDSPNIVLM